MSNFLAGPSVQTTNTDLAACLTAVGIGLDKQTPVRRLEGDASRMTFFFNEVSPCGQYHTRELMLAWDDLTWPDRFPEHPFAYLMAGFRNRARLRDYIKKAVPTVMIAKNGKFGFAPLNCDARTETLVLRELKKG